MGRPTQERSHSVLARLPFVGGYLELDAAPRRFLFFGFFNVVSWQCIAGPFLILFARHIDMPASYVGFLVSFMPLSMILVAGTVELVTRLGSKRLMVTAWMLRNLTACTVFLMPWAMSHWGHKAGWLALMGATLAFCMTRALGVGGWFPWIHELVPPAQRGAFFSTEVSVVQIVNVLVMAGQGLALQGDPGLSRFLLVYGVGICSGLFSVVLMARIPGGHGSPVNATMKGSLGGYGQALSDWTFIRFVITVALSYSCVAWLTASLVLYMRDSLLLLPQTIMMFMAAGSIGSFVTIRFWGRFADHSGSALAMFKTLTAHSIAALACLLMIPGAVWTPYLLVPVILGACIFVSAFATASNRAMLNYVGESGRVGYTNVWLVATSLTQGLTPILAGQLIERWEMSGFRMCFIISGVAGIACALLCRWTVYDAPPLPRSLSPLLNPAMPLRVLGRIVWITLGLHESSRASNGSNQEQALDERDSGT
jgi:Major Facilitator Superfamily